MQISKSIDTIRERIVLLIRACLAQFWPQYYSVHYRLLIGTDRYKTIAVITAIASLLGISGYVAPVLQNLLEPQVADQNNFTNFRSLLLNVGSALIGAAAIAFSLVMFAMQVNVERMLHGLFQKLSSDRKILAAFLGSFLLAIFVACMSLVCRRIDDCTRCPRQPMGSRFNLIAHLIRI